MDDGWFPRMARRGAKDLRRRIRALTDIAILDDGIFSLESTYLGVSGCLSHFLPRDGLKVWAKTDICIWAFRGTSDAFF